MTDGAKTLPYVVLANAIEDFERKTQAKILHLSLKREESDDPAFELSGVALIELYKPTDPGAKYVVGTVNAHSLRYCEWNHGQYSSSLGIAWSNFTARRDRRKI